MNVLELEANLKLAFAGEKPGAFPLKVNGIDDIRGGRQDSPARVAQLQKKFPTPQAMVKFVEDTYPNVQVSKLANACPSCHQPTLVKLGIPHTEAKDFKIPFVYCTACTVGIEIPST